MQSIITLLSLSALVAAAPAPLARSMGVLPLASAADVYPSINIRAAASQSSAAAAVVRLTSSSATAKATISVATPRQPHTTIAAPRQPFTTTVSTTKTTTKSQTSKTSSATSSSTSPCYTNRAFKITLLPIANATSSNTTVTPAQTPAGYLGTDASNTWSLSNLISLRKLEAKAATFELSSTYDLKQQLPTQTRSLLRVQAAKAGDNYAGLGAAQSGFANGEDLTCAVAQVKVSVTGPKGKVTIRTEDRLRCHTPSNENAVLGKCKRFTWMWMFASVADVKAFCPGGSGALEMGIVWMDK